MRRLALLAVLTILLTAGCGGGDDMSAEPGATGTQGATGPTAGVLEITADEFLTMLLPEKTRAIESVAAATRGCADLAQEVEPSLVLVLSEAASEAEPDTRLSDLVEAEC